VRRDVRPIADGALMKRAAETAYDEIRRGILSGRFAPGERLKEKELSADLGVSRTPIREALRRLDQERLVNFVPNHGTYVADWAPQDLEEIFALRALLESHAARLAATRMSADELAELRRMVADMDEAIARGDSDGLTHANNRFHTLILSAAESPRLEAMVLRLLEVPLILRTFMHYSGDDLTRSMNHHRELLAAFAHGDPDWAQSVMSSHVKSAFSAFSRSGGPADSPLRAAAD
jgi:DNA-binding GntR family transcriptional regulator